MEFDTKLIDHAVQKDIVRNLVTNGISRFSELKPKRVESNLFMYHLGQLQKKGVIQKQNDGYSLTAMGRAFLDRVNLDSLVFRLQPKIITVLMIKNENNKWLMLKRIHEPHMNRLGFPSGKVHFGEDIGHAAERELKEKAGLTCKDLRLRGNVIMRFIDEPTKAVVNHVCSYIFTAQVSGEPKLNNDNKYWQSFWGSESELTKGNVFKGHEDILNLINGEEYFIQSFDYDSDF